ncbi:MAG TPA: carboxypeptidase-like regulatory domain-containing protein [Polyangiaceae bacterium]|nr:carboxypeptidase-like regulatory domain-containing protein [Polyangiaceae bacterium]
MRNLTWGLTLLMLGALAKRAEAAPLVDVRGQVALLDGAAPDGVHVTLGLDLDRDGTLNSFELVEAEVGGDGSYAVSYSPNPLHVDLKFVQFVTQLAADFQARGFEAVLDDGPLPVILRFEREGYSTLVKRFTTLSDLPRLDAVLVPLSVVACDGADCMAGDGSVHITGFPGGTGIQRAYARRYDPELDQTKFPGTFSDSENNLLISSGFTEIDLRDANGNHVSKLSSPVSVRFQTDPRSWASLRDLNANSGQIEVPMYSFDEVRGEWLSEAPGELQAADGSSIDEAAFASIQEGSYPDPVYVAFQTNHFSTFNCDAPNRRRACVQGRLVTPEGEPLVGAQVSVNGVSYSGSAGTVFTGSDGYFASDLMKSELAGEDTDGNGKQGETFRARVTASAAIGVFAGEPFDTPQQQGTIGATKSCRAPNCNCVDLGDIQGDFEPSRACTVKVNVTVSGHDVVGGNGPLAEGDALVGATVTGELSGGPSLPLDPTLCGGNPCGGGKTDANGVITFVVPVFGDSPQIQIKANATVSSAGDVHYYMGSLTVAGCSRKQEALTANVELKADHAALGDLGKFISSLGAAAKPSGSSPIPGIDKPKAPSAAGCGCRVGASDPSAPLSALTLGLGVASFALVRRGRRASARGTSR